MDQNMDNPEPQETPTPQTNTQSEPGPFSTNRPVVEQNKEAKQWAMFCHLAALAGILGIPFGTILGPLIIWLIKKDEFEFVREQGREALNFQISMTVYGLICVPFVCLAGIGIFLLVGIGIVDLIFVIIAAINVSDGKPYSYPLTIRFIK